MDGTVSYHSDTGSQKGVWSRLATTDQVEADAGWPREGRAWEENCQRGKVVQLNSTESFKKAWMQVRGTKESPSPILDTPGSQGFSRIAKNILKTWTNWLANAYLCSTQTL